MIRVGILGAESIIAGELIRLLIHHPEVELITLFSPSLSGHPVTSIHKGLVGDTKLRFSDTLELNNLNVVFITSTEQLNSIQSLPENIKVVYMPMLFGVTAPKPFDVLEYVPGVAEMFRKPLVRGARGAQIYPPYFGVSLIVLFPLALNLLLNDSLKIKICLPEKSKLEVDIENYSSELEILLKKVQYSFTQIKEIEVLKVGTLRALSVEAEFNCSVSKSEIERIYNDIYDDHNFSFVVGNEPESGEVEGTQKCLIHISKPEDGILKIKATADSLLRGGAGDAVHSMNLLFGLFEKIGLSFPAMFAFN